MGIMKSKAIKFVLATLSVIIGLMVLDFSFGVAVEYARKNAKGGDTHNNYYILNELRDSVIIMGSSRANHHYVTDSIAARLHTSVYNCDIDGNGILLSYAFLKNMVSRGACPSMIIYELFPIFDLYENDDHTNPLTHLRPAYNAPGVSEVLADIDPDEAIKNRLASYRYNSVFIQNISDAISPKQLTIRGYKPIYGKITTDFQEKINNNVPLDTLKIKYFDKFLRLCDANDIRLIFVTSAQFHKTDLTPSVKRFLREHDITPYGRYRYIDFSDNPDFNCNKELFADPSHLNDDGARLFTRLLLDSITAR